MMVRFFCFVVLLICVSLNANAKGKYVPFMGVFEPNAKVCDDELLIGTKTIEWINSSMVCPPVKYKILQENRLKGAEYFVYFIPKPIKGCGIRVIELQRLKDYTYTWNAIAYKSLADFKKRESYLLKCQFIHN